MDIGVVKEIGPQEYRVALAPQGVRELVSLGHRVFVEHDAGTASRYDDRAYQEAGAEIAFGRDEVFRRGNLILTVRTPSVKDVEVLDQGQTIMGFLHLTVAPKDLLTTLRDRKATAIAYELIEEATGQVPILAAIGSLAGQMVVHIAAHLLEKESGGRGILLGGVQGLDPAKVLVLGAGTVGRTAAKLLAASGAHVIILDRDKDCLAQAVHGMTGRVEMFPADTKNVARFTAVADAVIGAVRIPGERAPYIVTRDMVSKMRPGCVIIDVAIDQGGCVETSRPTTLSNPTFVTNGVVHYCVPNLTANIPRTASKLLSQTVLPYVTEIARAGSDGAIGNVQSLRKGTVVQNGRVLVPDVAERIQS